MRYYIIAGEASGDLHGSNLIKSIKAKDANAVIQCWGGDLMQAAGGQVVKHYRSLAFMGLVEVVMNLSTILKNIKFCKQDIANFNPDVLICIDYPGFNLRIAKWAKQKGLKVIYFIAPQVWAWKENRVPYLPSHPVITSAGPIRDASVTGPHVGAVSSAPYGSANILTIPWAYISMMGPAGLERATHVAILNANYVAHRLQGSYPVLYTGRDDLVAHECILDLRPITKETGVTVDDVAKRLIDYGFHAPTMSFPVAGTLMVESTESENLAELDRFCDAMLAIRSEIDRVVAGEWPADDNPLHNAPHTAADLTTDFWTHPYTRECAGWPNGHVAARYWPPVSRIDGAHGDRNLVCSCPPIEAFAEN